MTGVVVTIGSAKSFVFLSVDGDGANVFAHISQFQSRRLPVMGERYSFEIEDFHGKPVAVRLERIEDEYEPAD